MSNSDIEFLREYSNSGLKNSEKWRDQIQKTIRQLKKIYFVKLFTVIKRVLDIPLIMHFLGSKVISEAVAGLFGVASSVVSIYSLVKFIYA